MAGHSSWSLRVLSLILLSACSFALPLAPESEATTINNEDDVTLSTELKPPPIPEEEEAVHMLFVVNVYAITNISGDSLDEMIDENFLEKVPDMLGKPQAILVMIDEEDEKPVDLDEIVTQFAQDGYKVEKLKVDGETKVLKIRYLEDDINSVIDSASKKNPNVRMKRAACLKCGKGGGKGGYGGGGGGYGGGGYGGGGGGNGGGYGGGGGYPSGGGCGGGCGGGRGSGYPSGGGGGYPSGGGGGYPSGGGGGHPGGGLYPGGGGGGYPSGGGGGYPSGGGGGYPSGGGGGGYPSGGGGGGYPSGGGGSGGYPSSGGGGHHPVRVVPVYVVPVTIGHYPSGGGGGGHYPSGGGGGCNTCGGGGGGGGSYAQASAQASASSWGGK